FGALNQITDVVNVLCLEAVRRTHGQFQVVNRTQQNRIDLVFLLYHNRLVVTLEVDKCSQLLLQDSRSTTDRLFGIQGAVGFKIDDQLVEVGTLLNTSVFDHISHATNRAEGGVELKTANTAALIFIVLTRISRLVTTAASDLELHVDRTVGRQIGDQVIAIDDFDIVIQLDIGSGNSARALLHQAQGHFITAVQLDGDTFEVEQDFDDIFLHALDGAVLVEHTVDLGLDHSAAGHGGQQNTTQRVAKGVAKTTLEGLESDLGTGRTDHLHIDMAGGQELIYRTLHGDTYFLAPTS